MATHVPQTMLAPVVIRREVIENILMRWVQEWYDEWVELEWIYDAQSNVAGVQFKDISDDD